MSTFTRVIRGTDKVRPQVPQLSVPNDTRAEQWVSSISVIANPFFVQFGQLEIWIRNLPFYNSGPDGFRSARVRTITGPPYPVRPGEAIEFYAWNPHNSEPVECSVGFAMSFERDGGGDVIPTDIEQIQRLTAVEVRDQENAAQEWLNSAVASVGGLPPANAYRAAVETVRTAGFGLQNQEALAADMAAGAQDATQIGLARAFADLPDTLPIPSTESPALFPARIYRSEAHAKTVNLQGARNMIVTLAASRHRTVPYEADPPRRFQSYSRDTYPIPIADHLARLRQTPRPTGTQITNAWRYVIFGTGARNSIWVPWHQLFIDLNRDPSDVPADIRLRWDRTLPAYRYTWEVGKSGQTRDYAHNIGARFYVTGMQDGDGNELPALPVSVTGGPHVVYVLDASNEKNNWGYVREQYRYDPNVFGWDNIPYRYLRLLGYVGYSITYTVLRDGSASSNLFAGAMTDPDSLIMKDMANWSGPALPTVLDLAATGGRASLSFEVRDAIGAWRTFVPAVAVTEGGSKILQLGRDNSSYILPSSSNLFRARLDITGAIDTAASIILHS